MTDGPYFLGYDGGTESMRVGIFDREGTPITFAAEPYTLKHPRPGWAEGALRYRHGVGYCPREKISQALHALLVRGRCSHATPGKSSLVDSIRHHGDTFEPRDEA